jgi:hypothetical protein
MFLIVKKVVKFILNERAVPDHFSLCDHQYIEQNSSMTPNTNFNDRPSLLTILCIISFH